MANTIIISAVKGIAGLAARFGDGDIIAQKFNLSAACGSEPSVNAATFALQAVGSFLESFSEKKDLVKGTYTIFVQDQIALRLVAIPSYLKNGDVDSATIAATKNLYDESHEELLAGIVYLTSDLAKRGVQIYFANARSLLQYELQAVTENATLDNGDVVEMDHSKSVGEHEGKFICRDNSFVTGDYTVEVTNIRRPDGSVRNRYMVNRHNDFGTLGTLNARDILKLLGTEEGTKALMAAANERGDSAVKWVSNLALYRAVIGLLPKIRLSENFNKISDAKLI